MSSIADISIADFLEHYSVDMENMLDLSMTASDIKERIADCVQVIEDLEKDLESNEYSDEELTLKKQLHDQRNAYTQHEMHLTTVQLCIANLQQEGVRKIARMCDGEMHSTDQMALRLSEDMGIDTLAELQRAERSIHEALVDDETKRCALLVIYSARKQALKTNK